MISTRFCPVCGAENKDTQTQCFSCGQLLPKDAQDEVMAQGTLLHGRYRLGNTLGSGGYSAVYRAWDTQAGERVVAIKQITLHGMGTEETIEATNTYNREVEALSTLSHPQVPRLYDHFSDPDHWYLVLEYIEGQTLEDYIEVREARGKPFQMEEILGIGLQLCAVLTYLHSQHPPIIFRDLKPDNIMRAPSGKLYLIDFGIARHYTPGQSRDTQSLGSPGYAAPEQYGRAQTDVRTDLYGLGALLHQLLSGHDPSETPRNLPPLHLNGQSGSGEMERLVAHLLADDPQDRPASAHDVARELERIRQRRINALDSKRIWQPPVPQNYPAASSSPVQAQFQQQTMQTKRKRLTRRRMLVALGIGVVLAGGGFEAYNVYSNSNRPSIPSPAVTSGPTTLLVYTGHSNTISSLAWSPDSLRIASASWDGTMQVWDAKSGANVYTYGESSHVAINAVAWSLNGSYTVFGAGNGSVWLLTPKNDLDTEFSISGNINSVEAVAWVPTASARYFALGYNNGTTTIQSIASSEEPSVLNYQTGAITSVAYSADGLYLATGAQDHTVVTWDTHTHKRVYIIYKGHTAAVTSVLWLPNSAYIASASFDGTVQIWDATNGGRLVMYTRHTASVNAIAVSPDGSYLASASNDMTVQVWSTFDGSPVMTYRGHSAAATSVAWSPDGKYIASGSEDETVRVWQAPPPPLS